MRKREQFPDPDLDQEEEVWWNVNAQVVEGIWAMDEPVRRVTRSGYLGRARRFFLDSVVKLPATVLEVGCGSGWVGRMIVDPKSLQVFGLDLASEQIRLADDNAAKEGLSESCKYRCQNLSEFAATDAASVSSVLIHAILHHLSWSEIDNVLAEVKALGSGTRIFVYEPVFLRPEGGGISLPAALLRILSKIPLSIRGMFDRLVRPTRNTKLIAEVNELSETAGKKGWVLSPKEVVFEEGELLQCLGKIGHVTDRYLCNFTSMAEAQYATTLTNAGVQSFFIKTVLPISQLIDRILFKSGYRSNITGDYVFMGYHVIVR